MSAQYSYDGIYQYPEYIEYQGEIVKKRLMNEKANFAYLKFQKAIKKRLSDIENL